MSLVDVDQLKYLIYVLRSDIGPAREATDVTDERHAAPPKKKKDDDEDEVRNLYNQLFISKEQ